MKKKLQSMIIVTFTKLLVISIVARRRSESPRSALIFSSEDQNEARSACYTFFLRLRDAVSAVAESRSTVLYLNMMTAPIGRIKGKFRFQILLKMKTDGCCEKLTDMFFDMYNTFDNAKVLLDAEINPTGLY